MPKMAKTTLKILAMSNELSNREVADALDIDIDAVKYARTNHKIVYKKTPRDKGYKAKILAIATTDTPKNIAATVGCSVHYVRAVLIEARKNNKLKINQKALDAAKQ